MSAHEPPAATSDAEHPFDFAPGRIPLLVSMPHVGTELSKGLAQRLTADARSLPDTDWHLPRLYDFLTGIGASILAARFSRFVIDLNRPPDDAPLYKAATTGLCPDVLFDGRPVYRDGQAPDAAERQARLDAFWCPYHAKIEAELARMRQTFGLAVLFDAHSIRSIIPRLFEGRLPDFNIGTAEGASADVELEQRLDEIARSAHPYTHVLNGRFKGGYITRHYGRPSHGWHAVQLELAQTTYMDEEAPFRFREDKASQVRPHLRRFVEALADFATARARSR